MTLWVAGCQQPTQKSADSREARMAANAQTGTTAVGPFDVRLSENERLGEIIFVSLEDAHVVIRTDPDVRIPASGMIVVRRADFQPTAVLELVGVQEGSAVGAHILFGQPQVGEEVVAPGPKLRTWGNSVLPADARGAP